MGSSVLVLVSEYLSTTYRPDRDYVDGELKERNVGEQPHAHVQSIIAGIFREQRRNWGVRALTEQRVQVRASNFRIPDVCVLRNTDPKDEIISFAPLICVEVLSSDDRKREVQERVQDYAQLGVQNIWVIDPWRRVGYYASVEGWTEVEDGVLRAPGTPMQIDLVDVFAELDEF